MRLRRFLIAVGDLADEEALETGVRRFQGRHGLAADGVIGPATRTQHAVPLSQRVRQIELSMERLRWLPDRDTERLIGVNIPMFRLWAVEGRDAVFTTEVIVGRAVNTRTPVMIERLEQIVFRPYWNVPASILRNEILPALRRDPHYLRKHNMEFVRDGPTRRVRQRPGPANALGLIKFSFPNDENVYMHGTPTPSLFRRPRRDFSHGCIRVADPVGLAEWLLGPEGWSRERIVAAMDTAPGGTVTLAQPVRVVLFYLTAFAVPGDGMVYFADDLYGHDARLDRAWKRPR
jgi:murein L,D-transpeptidase YcbB/YkuD